MRLRGEKDEEREKGEKEKIENISKWRMWEMKILVFNKMLEKDKVIII